MSAIWRKAGLNYLEYSNICAGVLRRALKRELKVDAEKRDNPTVKCVQWVKGNPMQTRTENT